MRSLNRLKWLHAFEATARHGSFTGAAQELGVTPAAVGQLVRALEDWVGQVTRSAGALGGDHHGLSGTGDELADEPPQSFLTSA